MKIVVIAASCTFHESLGVSTCLAYAYELRHMVIRNASLDMGIESGLSM